MVAGPEINKMLNAFDFLSSEEKDSHCEDNDSHETDFRKDVLPFKRVLEDKGNPFLEKELIHIISKILMNEAAIQSVKNVSSIGQQQYEIYKCERLIQGKYLFFHNFPKQVTFISCQKSCNNF